jgi:hypothetical protein
MQYYSDEDDLIFAFVRKIGDNASTQKEML